MEKTQEEIINETMKAWNKKVRKAEKACIEAERYDSFFWDCRELAHFAERVCDKRSAISWLHNYKAMERA